MRGTNAALPSGRPTISHDDDQFGSAYVQVLTRGAQNARSVEGESGYWASLGAKLIAAAVIGLAVLAIIAMA
jgi:hypothetical protein